MNVLLTRSRIYGAVLLYALIVLGTLLLCLRINTLLAALLVLTVDRSVPGQSGTVYGLCLCLNRLCRLLIGDDPCRTLIVYGLSAAVNRSVSVNGSFAVL